MEIHSQWTKIKKLFSICHNISIKPIMDIVFDFMGKSFIFHPLHIPNLMQGSNIHKPIRINIEDPIDFNKVRRIHVHNRNEGPPKTNDNLLRYLYTMSQVLKSYCLLHVTIFHKGHEWTHYKPQWHPNAGQHKLQCIHQWRLFDLDINRDNNSNANSNVDSKSNVDINQNNKSNANSNENPNSSTNISENPNT